MSESKTATLIEETPIARAIRLLGGQSAAARRFDIAPQAVQQWVASGQVSHKRVRQLSELSGVPATELRPDIFGA